MILPLFGIRFHMVLEQCTQSYWLRKVIGYMGIALARFDCMEPVGLGLLLSIRLVTFLPVVLRHYLL